jgi:hypothetical protein
MHLFSALAGSEHLLLKVNVSSSTWRWNLTFSQRLSFCSLLVLADSHSTVYGSTYYRPLCPGFEATREPRAMKSCVDVFSEDSKGLDFN